MARDTCPWRTDVRTTVPYRQNLTLNTLVWGLLTLTQLDYVALSKSWYLYKDVWGQVFGYSEYPDISYLTRNCLVTGRYREHWFLQVPTPFSLERDVLEQLPPNLYLLGVMLARQLGLRRWGEGWFVRQVVVVCETGCGGLWVTCRWPVVAVLVLIVTD